MELTTGSFAAEQLLLLIQVEALVVVRIVVLHVDNRHDRIVLLGLIAARHHDGRQCRVHAAPVLVRNVVRIPVVVDRDHVVLDAVRNQVDVDLARCHAIRGQVEDRHTGAHHREVVVDLRRPGHVLIATEDVLLTGCVRDPNIDRVADHAEVTVVKLQLSLQADADPLDERMELTTQPFFAAQTEAGIWRNVEVLRQDGLRFKILQVFVDAPVFELFDELSHLVGILFESIHTQHAVHVVDELNRRIDFDMCAVRNHDVGVLVFEAGNQRLEMRFGRQTRSERNRCDARRSRADAHQLGRFKIDFAHDRCFRIVRTELDIDTEATSFDVDLTIPTDDLERFFCSWFWIFTRFDSRERLHSDIHRQLVPRIDRVRGEDVVVRCRNVDGEVEFLVQVVDDVGIPVESVNKVVLVALDVDHVLLALRDLERRAFSLHRLDSPVHCSLDIRPDLEAERSQRDRPQGSEALLCRFHEQLIHDVLHSNAASCSVLSENSIGQTLSFEILVFEDLVDRLQERLCTLSAFENACDFAANIRAVGLEQSLIEFFDFLIPCRRHTKRQFKIFT